MADRARVWELASELGVPSAAVIDALRARNEWVASHLSTVPDTAVDDLRRTLQTTPGSHLAATSGGAPRRPGANPFADPGRPPAPGRRPGWYRPRRRSPGPPPVTYQPPWTPIDPDDDYTYDHYDPREELPLLSARDVAELCGVRPAAVRQWVTRGHLTPIGKNGASHIFDTISVLAAAHLIGRRTKQRARPADRNTRRLAPPGLRNAGQQLTTNDQIRMARVYGNRPLNTADAAALLGVKAATIRSWVRRGHLQALPTTGPRRLEFGLADLLRSTGHRHI